MLNGKIKKLVKTLKTVTAEIIKVFWSDTYFEIINVCKEVADKAEGNNPLTDRTGPLQVRVL